MVISSPAPLEPAAVLLFCLQECVSVVCYARCHASLDYDIYHEHCLQQHARKCKYLGMGGQNR